MSKRRLLTNNELTNASPTTTILPQGTADKEVSQAPSELVWHSQLDMGVNSSPRQSTSRRASNLKGAQNSPNHLVLDMSPSTHKSQPPTEKTYGLDTLPIMPFPQYNGAVKPSTARASQPTRLDCLQASDYPFIRLPDLSKMPSEDIDCLSLQGCLQLPPRLILDEFVRQYFLHVHPIMPLLDEGHFWDIYCDRLGDGPDIERIPMVLFQAMLFVSCSFVPRNITDALGFDCPRLAAASLYKRAKLLFDLNTESSSIALAQSALLLTYWPTSIGIGPSKPNTIWLSMAIHYAKSVHAHRMLDRPSVPPTTISQDKRKRTLRRLWWCCIIRDRILSLGLRRSIQIPKKYPPLESEDFEEEINCSLVHEPSTKRHLVCILQRVMELCVVLTDLLPLLSLSDESLEEQRICHTDSQSKLNECQQSLSDWYSATRRQFPIPRKGNQFRHQSVIVHTNMMYIYYHAARLGLHHQEVLVSTCLSPTGTMDAATRSKKRREVRKATMRITDRLKESMQLGLVRYFPISVLALIAMPLLLLILDVKMQAPRHNCEKASMRQDCLRTLVQAMNEYHLQYHGVDLISHTIHHVVDLAQLDPALQATGEEMGWGDVITHRPVQYLRLTLIMDLSLTHAKLPENYEFPSNLQRLLCDKMGAAAFLPWNLSSPVNDSPDSESGALSGKARSPDLMELSDSPATTIVPATIESVSTDENDAYADPLSHDFSFALSTELDIKQSIGTSTVEGQEPTGEDTIDWDGVVTDAALDSMGGVPNLDQTVEDDHVEQFVSMLYQMAEAEDDENFRLEEQLSPSHQWLGPSTVEMPS